MFQRPLIAIDVGSSAVKVVELTGGKRQKKLRAIGLETLPPGAVVDGALQQPDTVEQVLKHLLKKLKISTTGRRAALALAGSSVIIKKIMVQTSKDQELAEQVYYEAEQHFQADMAEIYFDFAELGQGRDYGGMTPVLLVGAKREMVEQYIALVRSVGLRTGVIECDVLSTANMFEFNYGVVEGLTAIVNVGASATQVSLVSFGEYVYTRDVPIGGEEYTRRIMEAFGVDRDNAETLKIAASQGEGTTPDELLRILGEVNDQLVSEIQVTIDYYFQSGELAQGELGLTSTFLTGGGARVLGLDAALAAALAVPVQIINPFQNVQINPKRFQMDYLLMQGHLYGVAVGLGMRAMGDSA